jgi:hypothetical protein
MRLHICIILLRTPNFNAPKFKESPYSRILREHIHRMGFKRKHDLDTLIHSFIALVRWIHNDHVLDYRIIEASISHWLANAKIIITQLRDPPIGSRE